MQSGSPWYETWLWGRLINCGDSVADKKLSCLLFVLEAILKKARKWKWEDRLISLAVCGMCEPGDLALIRNWIAGMEDKDLHKEKDDTGTILSKLCAQDTTLQRIMLCQSWIIWGSQKKETEWRAATVCGWTEHEVPLGAHQMRRYKVT